MQTITDSYLSSAILKNGQLLQLFPFLVPAKLAMDAVSGCQSCKRNRSAKEIQMRTAFNNVKRAIALLPPEDKDKLKKILNQNRLSVQWTEQVGSINKRKIESF